MLGVIGHDGDNLSLRQICQRFDGKCYHDRLQSASIVAGIFNSQGGLNGRGVGWKDFHPEHSLDDPFAVAGDTQTDEAFKRLAEGLANER